MKKTLSLLALIAALLPLSPLTARGELITVKGIKFEEEGKWSTATGWFDASKTWSGDGLLCWAATSSNLIAWWQSQNPDYQKEGDPWGVDAVWDIYKNTFINDGGIISKGVEWWFDGTGIGSTSAELQYRENHVSSGGYYKDHLYGGTVEMTATPANITTLYSVSYNQASSLASTLVDYMRNGYAVGLNFVSGKQGHAETLWGIEYDTDTHLITRLYISDSDDSLKPGIRILDMSVKQKDGYQTFCQSGTTWEIESFVLLSSSMTNDIARLNTYDEDSHTVTLRQKVGNAGYLLPGDTKDFNKIEYDNSRNEETHSAVSRQLTIDKAHDGTHADAIHVDATAGINWLEVQAGATLSVDVVSGAGTLTKTGTGTLRLTGAAADSTGAHISVNSGMLMCENGTLAEITLSGNGLLHGNGKMYKVAVNGGTLSIGKSPGYQQYSGGSLTLSQATLEFYLDGLSKESSYRNGTGWGSGTYSNLDMNGGSIYVYNSNDIAEINIYLGGEALAALSTENSFNLELISGIKNSYFKPDYDYMAAHTHFYVSDEPGATAGTTWRAGDEITDYINFRYQYIDGSEFWGPSSLAMVGSFKGVAAPDVPEPATSTLSLLALAGLMTRRRRK